jgi:hypothetical protein
MNFKELHSIHLLLHNLTTTTALTEAWQTLLSRRLLLICLQISYVVDEDLPALEAVSSDYDDLPELYEQPILFHVNDEDEHVFSDVQE